jgi:predicted transcriptional regulator
MAKPKPSIRAKWPGSLLAAGFVPVARVFLRNFSRLGLSASEALFLINLLDYKWGERPAFPSQRKLAADMQLSVFEVGSAIEALVEKGFLERVRVGESGEGYEFAGLYRHLEELLKSGKAWTPYNKASK